MLNSSKLSSTTEVMDFPDTVVDITSSAALGRSKLPALNEDESYTIIGDVLPTPSSKQQQQRSGAKKKGDSVQKNPPVEKNQEGRKDSELSEAEKSQQAANKRGQKGKIKKIKEKYKDQDEDERKLKMELLQSAGPARDKSKSKKKTAEAKKKTVTKSNPQERPRPEGTAKETGKVTDKEPGSLEEANDEHHKDTEQGAPDNKVCCFHLAGNWIILRFISSAG